MMREDNVRAAAWLRPGSSLIVFSILAAACTTLSPPPAPIDPVAIAEVLTARSLDNPEIAAALQKMGLTPNSGWTLDALTVAAWSLRSDIAVATADVTAGTAAERVAGLLPNPTLSLDPSYFVTNFLQDPSPWVIATALSFPIETAGKRSIRVAQAQADTETRRWKLAETLWQARAELRRAIVARAVATQNVTLAEREVALSQSYIDFIDTQIRFGLGVGSDRLTAQISLARAQVQLRTARGDLALSEAQIAAATGIPVENLPLAELAPLGMATLPVPNPAELLEFRDLAIVNRLTVRHALADYVVAEEALRQAIAKQYPDFSLGPGYSFDRGDHAITLATGLMLPLLHDERDAIAEAVAIRARSAAQFEASQSLALAEIEAASARYRTGYAAWTDARNTEETARRAVEEVQRRLQSGAADRGAVTSAQLNLALAERASLDALRSVTDALGSLEDSVQRPIWPQSNLALPRPDKPSTE